MVACAWLRLLLRARRSDDRLHLEAFLETLTTDLPPDARRLVPAERSDEVHRVLVHAEGTGTHAAGDVHALRHVGRPHRAGEAVLAVVRDTHRFALVVVGDHGDDRPEDLLTRDPHVV